MRPPASTTSRSNSSSTGVSVGSPAGRSTASVQPGAGKESIPWPGPKRLRTPRKAGRPSAVRRLKTPRTAASAPEGATDWDLGPALGAQALEDRADDALRAEGDNELVLEQAARAVEAVPVAHTVERVEEDVERLEAPALLPRRAAVVELVEGAHRGGVEEAAGDAGRDPEGPAGGVGGAAVAGTGLRRVRVVAADEDGAPEAAALEAVDPRDRVAVARVLPLHAVHDVVEVAGALRVDQHAVALDAGEPH